MQWLLALHVVFVVTWFAGLFYLPRLFIYHIEAPEPVVRERFKVMEKRLLGITHTGGALAVALGLSLMIWLSITAPAVLWARGWFYVKLALVVVLIAYHLMLVWMTRRLAHDELRWSSHGLRMFNEIPGVLLIVIVIMVVVQPF